ncbi:class I SAM-dependent methyltransferase [Chitinimonas sp.]|uniref:class I SAM-dependent methyltransferase n=1 Tax=Chitinimonas sp. TaxID=1934313 RepID=UPI0035AE3598
MKRLLSLLALFALSSTALADDALKAAIAGSHRSPANVARDAARHPYETLSFFGIRPDMTVVELNPGGGWYTEILAPYLRDKGVLYEATFSASSDEPRKRAATERFQKKLNELPAVYGKVKLSVFDPPKALAIAPAASADMVLTFRNVHNWIDPADATLKAVFKHAFDTLKPGGIFGVVDHRLPEDRPQDATASTGYVHASYVIKLAEGAGFKLAAQSDINANPKDTADHPEGVWTLPPVYALKDKDRAKYEAIGESNRFTLKFVKPGAGPVESTPKNP